MNELVSIIVPVYNTDQYLQRCLESILNQTYTNLEIIVVNDGSTDDSSRIIEEYAIKDSRIQVIDQKNGGPSKARNTALDVATGEFIAFLDSDDWISLNCIEKCAAFCIKNKCDVVCFRHILTTDPKIIIENKVYNDGKIVNSIEGLKLLNDESIIQSMVCDKFFAASCFKNIRFPIGKKYEDSFTTYKVFMECNKIGVISDPLYYYYQRIDSIIHMPTQASMIDLVDSYIARYINTSNILDAQQKKIMMGNIKKKYILLKRYCRNNASVCERENWILQTCKHENISNSALTELLFQIARFSHYAINLIYALLGEDNGLRKRIRLFYLCDK